MPPLENSAKLNERERMTMRKIPAVLFVCVLIAGAAQAGTIFSRTGDPLDATQFWALGGFSGEALATSWQQSVTSTNTTVTVLGLIDYGPVNVLPDTLVQFDLLTGGPAGSPVTLPVSVTLNGGQTNYIVFNGLTLGPATYYLVASVPSPSLNQLDAIWTGINPATLNFQQVGTAGPESFQVAGSGFIDYPLELGLTVASNIPEPATWGLLLIGLGVLARRKLRA